MFFIAFEGIDSSGKSTLIDLFCSKLEAAGLDFVKTREPGSGAIGAKIREILLEKQNNQLDPLAETLLYYADRRQHIEQIIKPCLKQGKPVVSDRFWASTSAYQCGGRGIDENFVERLREKVCGGFDPDLWILLDLPVEESLRRLLASKKDQRDRMEREGPDFHERVRSYYLKLAAQSPSKWLILDALKSPEELLSRLLQSLKEKGLFELSS